MSTITTARLNLLPFTPQAMLAASRSPAHFTALTGLPTAADWPNPDLADVLPLFADALAADPRLTAFNRLLVLTAPSLHPVQLVIGEAGFKAWPQPDQYGDLQVEIGYGVAASWRGHGLATEAVIALCNWVVTTHHVTSVQAECLADNRASARVLQRAGFIQAASTAQMLRWRWCPPAPQPSSVP
jgi:[ribosomal protein S5]-alanine N-acetyltransferase